MGAIKSPICSIIFKIWIQILIVNIMVIAAMEFVEHNHRTGLIFIDHGKARASYHTHRLVYDIDLSKFKEIRPTIIKHLTIMEKYSDTPESQAILENINAKLYEMENIENLIEIFKWVDSVETNPKFENTKINFENIKSNQLNQADRSNKSKKPITHEVIRPDRPSFDDIEDQINRLQTMYERDKMTTIQQISELLQTLTTEHNQISEQILIVLKCQDVNQLVEVSQLINNLKFIDENPLKTSEQLPNDFIEKNSNEIYQITTIKSPIYNLNDDSRLLVEIDFPVIDSEHFSIVEILSVPINLNGFSVILIPMMQYALVNDYDFIPITKSEFLKSKLNFYGEKIVKPTKSKYNNCEMSILLNPNRDLLSKYCNYRQIPTANYIVPVDGNGLYYVSVAKLMNGNQSSVEIVSELCLNGTERHEVGNSGMLRLSKDCRLQIGDRVDLTSENTNKSVEIKFRPVSKDAESNAIAIINEKIIALNDTDIKKTTKTTVLIDRDNAIAQYMELIQEVHLNRINMTKLNEIMKKIYGETRFFQFIELNAMWVFFSLIFLFAILEFINKIILWKCSRPKHDDLVQKVNPIISHPILTPSTPL